jgi:hypothetical protein
MLSIRQYICLYYLCFPVFQMPNLVGPLRNQVAQAIILQKLLLILTIRALFLRLLLQFWLWLIIIRCWEEWLHPVDFVVRFGSIRYFSRLANLIPFTLQLKNSLICVELKIVIRVGATLQLSPIMYHLVCLVVLWTKRK